MEPDPTDLSAPLNDDTDDDELYERLQRRHVVKEKATYVCLVLFIMLLLAAALPAMLYWLAAYKNCLLYTSPSPRDQRGSRMPSSA